MKSVRPLFVVLFLAVGVFAQGVSATISPNPATAGAPVTITVQDATGAGFFYHPPACFATTFHAGIPNGPVIPTLSALCSTGFTAVPAYGAVTRTATVPAAAIGVVYWKVNRYTTASNTSLVVEWFCFNVQPATEPVLAATTVAQVGQTFAMNLTYPAGAAQPYIAAASLTTNTGINGGPGLFVSLDFDLLFNLSFPSADPFLFSNFLGLLDGTGTATGVAVNIPNFPPLAYLPLHIQAAVVPAIGPIKLTNVVNACIAP